MLGTLSQWNITFPPSTKLQYESLAETFLKSRFLPQIWVFYTECMNSFLCRRNQLHVLSYWLCINSSLWSVHVVTVETPQNQNLVWTNGGHVGKESAQKFVSLWEFRSDCVKHRLNVNLFVYLSIWWDKVLNKTNPKEA